MEGVPTSRNDLDQLTELLKARNVNPRKGNDSLIWAPSKIRHYNPKDGYRVLVSNVVQDQLDIPKKLFAALKLFLKQRSLHGWPIRGRS